MQFRRRREGKTNYRRRLALLKSRKIRIVVRKSLKNIGVQFIKYSPKGDEILASAISSQLQEYGWDGSCSNAPSAYLTGFLAGKKAKEIGIEEGVLDIGLYPSTKGGNVFAALKGILDAGIEVSHGKEILPSKKRLMGEHINDRTPELVEKVMDKIGG